MEQKMSKTIRFSVTPNNDIPAFAGYLSGSVREPEAKVIVNIEAMVNAAADKENDISFEEIFVTSVVHEMLHAIQDIYHREFDEEEVERVLLEASEQHYGEERESHDTPKHGTTYKENNMKAAITVLEITLEALETNEKVNRKEGNAEQADCEATNAAEVRQALAVLKSASDGPIWPKPS